MTRLIRTRRVTWCLQLVALLITLISYVLAVRTIPLPPIDESVTLPDKSTRAQESGDAAQSHSSQATGPIDADLYAPGPRFRYSILQRVPVSGLVRGQQGKLVPYQLTAPIEIFQSPVGSSRSSSTRGFGWSSRRYDGDSPPSSNRQMLELMEEHEEIKSAFEQSNIPDTSTIGTKYHVAQLRGHVLDARTIEMLQQAGRPFFVQGAGQKLWYFDTKDGGVFTFTDRIEGSDRRFLRTFWSEDLVRAAQASGAVQRGGIDRAVASIIAAQGTIRQAMTGNSWLQKLSSGFRNFLSRSPYRT